MKDNYVTQPPIQLNTKKTKIVWDSSHYVKHPYQVEQENKIFG